jgi:serine/threonine protein kinase, bacterial
MAINYVILTDQFFEANSTLLNNYMRKILSLLTASVLIASCTKRNDVIDTSKLIAPTIVPTVTTFAGSGTGGYVDATRTFASFKYPTGICINADGFIYIADKENNVIRKISPLGEVTTLAGTGTSGFANGTFTAAQFNAPVGVVADGSGNVYVADQANSLIREILSTGSVITFAGNGSGSANGAADTASFRGPAAVALDGNGNLFVADEGNNMIRKITSKGIVSTFAGSGKTGSANSQDIQASFNQPVGLAVDTAGNVYVADEGNNMIRKISPLGAVTTFAGSGARGSADGAPGSASFNAPTGLAIDAGGNLYVADSNNNLIRKITPDGTVSTLAGTGLLGSANGAPPTLASFSAPQGVAVDVYGNVYVTDSGNNLIREITQ